MGLLVYSVNPWAAYHICQQYRGDVHRVWCSTEFDANKAGALTPAALVPPSSNPADLYRAARAAVRTNDKGNARIKEHRGIWMALAERWRLAGSVTADQRDEILYLVEHGPMNIWRPLLYLIPTTTLGARLTKVPPHERSGVGYEYRIEDLRGSEFDVIDFD